MRSKALREQRRRELEAEECTFRPSLGGDSAAGSAAGGGRGRRSSSADTRARGRAASLTSSSSRRESGVGPAAATAFAAREAAFQESKQQRLEALRKEKEALELQEATFQPVIGAAAAEGRRASGAGVGGSGSNDGSSRGLDVAGGDLSSASQAKAAPAAAAALERKDSVGFKVSPSKSHCGTTTPVVCRRRCCRRHTYSYRYPSV